MLNCIYDRTVCTLHIHPIIMVQFCFFFFISPSLRTANSEQWTASYFVHSYAFQSLLCVIVFHHFVMASNHTEREKGEKKHQKYRWILRECANVPMCHWYQLPASSKTFAVQKHIRIPCQQMDRANQYSWKFFKVIRLFSRCLFRIFFSETLSIARIWKSFEISFWFVFLPCQLPHQMNYKRQAEIYLVSNILRLSVAMNRLQFE